MHMLNLNFKQIKEIKNLVDFELVDLKSGIGLGLANTAYTRSIEKTSKALGDFILKKEMLSSEKRKRNKRNIYKSNKATK